MTVDHWEVNGVVQPDSAKPTFELITEVTSIVKAVLRPELKLTAVNAQMQLVDDSFNPVGSYFTEFAFDEAYDVDGKEHAGKTVSVEVTAIVPEGKVLSYWRINDVPYYTDSPAGTFRAIGIDASTKFEPMFGDPAPEVTDPPFGVEVEETPEALRGKSGKSPEEVILTFSLIILFS